MKVYRGDWRRVVVDGRPLPRRPDLVRRLRWDPTGTTKTALFILADCVGGEIALKHYRPFAFDVTVRLDTEASVMSGSWELTEVEIRKWFNAGPDGIDVLSLGRVTE